MNIVRTSDMNRDIKMNMSEGFVEGFYAWLKFFSKNPTKLAKAFEHMFNTDVFYVAVIEDNIVGMVACVGKEEKCVKLQKAELKKHLGITMGTITYNFLKKEFEDKIYPFELIENIAMVEFVVTSSRHRGQSVAGTVMKHIFSSTDYKEYVLEVADTNVNALKAYNKNGYKEFMRVKQKHGKKAGFDYLLYMKYKKI